MIHKTGVLKLERALLLAGAGKMGGALLAAWLDRGLDPAKVLVQDPAPPHVLAERLREGGGTIAAEIASAPPLDALVLAVKPQIMDSVLPTLTKLVSADTLVLSVAAGRSLASLARHLPQGTAIVRAMPNTPASIGRGMTVCCPNSRLTAEQKALCHSLLAAVGGVAWIEDETLMDAVTAVSGSGPAYLFLFAESLTEAAREQGLPAPLADKLVRAALAGASELLLASGRAPADLRKDVTSPGGTTAAALSVLMAAEKDGGEGMLQALVRRAVAAAVRRSRELGQ